MRRTLGLVVTVGLLCVASVALAIPYDAEVLADAPIRYLRLGEAAGPTALDSSVPHHADGTYVNLAAGDFAKVGALLSSPDTSVWLNGANAQITVPDAPDLRLTGDMSVEFWYQKTAEAGDWQRIVGKGDGTHRNYGIWEENGGGQRLLFQQYNNGGAVLNFFSNRTIPVGAWTHVAAVVQGNTGYLYINGALDATGARSAAPSTSADPLRIGYGQIHQYFPGYVDEVAVYDHALDGPRVQAHYLASFPQPTEPYPQIILGDGPNTYYRYDDPSSADGATVADSADSNPATYRGSVTLVPSGLLGAPGQAASFDGATDYIRLPTAPFGAYPTSGNTNAYSLSFETWFQTTGSGVILGQTNNVGTPGGAGPTGWVPAIYVDTTGRVRASMFWHSGADAAHQITSTGTYNDGAWHHAVDVYLNGIEYLYLDGTLIGQQAFNEFAYSGAYNYYLGTGYAGGSWPNTNGGWFFFPGSLDETAIYPAALTPAQIAEHYIAGVTFFIPEPATLALLGMGAALLARRRRLT